MTNFHYFFSRSVASLKEYHSNSSLFTSRLVHLLGEGVQSVYEAFGEPLEWYNKGCVGGWEVNGQVQKVQLLGNIE